MTVEKMIRLYGPEGPYYSVKRIANLSGHQSPYVKRRLLANGIVLRTFGEQLKIEHALGRFTPPTLPTLEERRGLGDDTLASLYGDAGGFQSVEVIARQFKTCRDTVKKRLIELGIPVRTRREQAKIDYAAGRLVIRNTELAHSRSSQSLKAHWAALPREERTVRLRKWFGVKEAAKRAANAERKEA